jgi:hypothetical protein
VCCLVGAPIHGGGFDVSGTAFFLQTVTEELGFQYLVTAKHVITDFRHDDVWLRINMVSGPPSQIRTKKADWIPHTDNTIDIMLLPCQTVGHGFDVLNVNGENFPLTKALSDEYQIGVGDEVYMTGAYVIRPGELRNLPIVRVGNIAGMPEEPVWPASSREPVYLIEVRSMAGLSGSPIFVRSNQFYKFLDLAMTQRVAVAPRDFLLGTIIGTHGRRQREDILVPEGEEDDDGKTDFSTGISLAVTADQIMQAINQLRLTEDRKAIAMAKKKASGYKPTSAPVRLDASETVIHAVSETDNPDHKEDFTALLNAAVRKPQSKD